MNTPGTKEDITQDEALEAAIAAVRMSQVLAEAALFAIKVGVSEKTFLDGARAIYRNTGVTVSKQVDEVLKAVDEGGGTATEEKP